MADGDVLATWVPARNFESALAKIDELHGIIDRAAEALAGSMLLDHMANLVNFLDRSHEDGMRAIAQMGYDSIHAARAILAEAEPLDLETTSSDSGLGTGDSGRDQNLSPESSVLESDCA